MDRGAAGAMNFLYRRFTLASALRCSHLDAAVQKVNSIRADEHS
jgi:hypothetical protein